MPAGQATNRQLYGGTEACGAVGPERARTSRRSQSMALVGTEGCKRARAPLQSPTPASFPPRAPQHEVCCLSRSPCATQSGPSRAQGGPPAQPAWGGAGAPSSASKCLPSFHLQIQPLTTQALPQACVHLSRSQKGLPSRRCSDPSRVPAAPEPCPGPVYPGCSGLAVPRPFQQCQPGSRLRRHSWVPLLQAPPSPTQAHEWPHCGAGRASLLPTHPHLEGRARSDC